MRSRRGYFGVSVDFRCEPYVFLCWFGVNYLKSYHFGYWGADDFYGAIVADEELGDFFWAADCG